MTNYLWKKEFPVNDPKEYVRLSQLDHGEVILSFGTNGIHDSFMLQDEDLSKLQKVINKIMENG